MLKLRNLYLLFFACLSLIFGGCAPATLPLGPTTSAMPPVGKPMQLFQQETQECKSYALEACGGQSAIDQINQQAATNTALTAGVGVLAGALIGAAGHGTGPGAQIGAAGGLLAGAGGANTELAQKKAEIQKLYDDAFTACMYSKGNIVAGQTPPDASTNTVPEADHMSVLDAQLLLQDTGYDIGSPDGKMGKKTKIAIRAFQAHCKIPVTGTLDPATITLLRNAGSH